jgi:hypothetical protein
MVATRALFDTNILIDYTHGIVEAELELSSYGIRGISIITWIEMLAGAKQNEEEATRRFLGRFELVPSKDETAGCNYPGDGGGSGLALGYQKHEGLPGRPSYPHPIPASSLKSSRYAMSDNTYSV